MPDALQALADGVAEMERPRVSGRHAFIKRLIKDFETNPRVQFRFHKYAMYFWLVNAAVVTVASVCFPRQWAAIGLAYVSFISLYANWDTDYDAMSASGAWMAAESLRESQGRAAAGISSDSPGQGPGSSGETAKETLQDAGLG